MGGGRLTALLDQTPAQAPASPRGLQMRKQACAPADQGCRSTAYVVRRRQMKPVRDIFVIGCLAALVGCSTGIAPDPSEDPVTPARRPSAHTLDRLSEVLPVGSSRAAVRELFGDPHKVNEHSWQYHYPGLVEYTVDIDFSPAWRVIKVNVEDFELDWQ
jgi:hypothetical protein